MKVIGLTGKPATALAESADIAIITAAAKYADRVQELHIKVIHILIELIERRLAPTTTPNKRCLRQAMPKRDDLKSILIIGAGPIVIGQACEFDYSGAQACKALKEEGYKVILVNSNPATIMTDPETADVTYIEPITWQVVERIIAKEKPDAILPTMGGQTALNCAMDLYNNGVLNKHEVELIGASPDAIEKAEDRLKFKDAMTRIGLASARSGVANIAARSADGAGDGSAFRP